MNYGYEIYNQEFCVTKYVHVSNKDPTAIQQCSHKMTLLSSSNNSNDNRTWYDEEKSVTDGTQATTFM